MRTVIYCGKMKASFSTFDTVLVSQMSVEREACVQKAPSDKRKYKLNESVCFKRHRLFRGNLVQREACIQRTPSVKRKRKLNEGVCFKRQRLFRENSVQRKTCIQKTPSVMRTRMLKLHRKRMLK